MSTVLKSLLAAAASLMAQAAFAQTTYVYTGNPFTLFSCGLSSSGNGTKDCPNAPAPGNPLTSYTATDHVTASLTVSSPLPPNLNYQDVTSFPGFQMSMNDGHQTLVTGTNSGPFFKARVSTDALGGIIGPWLLVINVGNLADSGIASENEPPVNPFVTDQGTLSCCDPLPQGNLALNFNNTGTWTTLAGGGSTALSFAGFYRIIQFDAYDRKDVVQNGIGIAGGTGSQLGMNFARTSSKPIHLTTPAGPIVLNYGPSVGVWSDSNQGSGSARALALVTFTAPPGGITFQVNTVLDGDFQHDMYPLPEGTLAIGAELLLADTAKLQALLDASNVGFQQFFMGSTPASGGITPQTAFANLQSMLGSALLKPPATIFPDPTVVPFDVLRTYPLNTPFVTVAEGKQFTIILDVAAYSFMGGVLNEGAGTGVVDFFNSLEPADNFLTDVNGNPVAVLPPGGPAPPLAPTPANLTLAAAQPSTPVGTSAAFTATLTDAASAAVPGVLVVFKVASGPNAGATGGGITDANGHASFSYTGVQGAGTDTVQASAASLSSNTVQEAWTSLPLTAGTPCNGTFNGTFSGNVTVAAGQNCTLIGGQTTGNILVTGGSLSLSHFTVGGNLQVQGGSVQTGPAVAVQGNLQVQNLPAGSPASRVCNTTVLGNMQVQGNAAGVQVGGDLTCPGNTIAGNLVVQSNTGPVQVTGNTVQKNLNCYSNTALSGSGNTATLKQGQCTAF
jgi:hypothetical protein